MGYCTEYKIEVIKSEDISSEQESGAAEHICNVLEDMAGYDFEGSLHEIIIAEAEPVKWYDHDRHMKELSRVFPELVFQLTGVGEEFPDLWRRFYRNGKSYYEEAEIIYPEFNEDKLE